MKPRKSKESSLPTSSASLIDLFHSQSKQIVNSVLILTRRQEIEANHNSSSRFDRSLSPRSDKEQMQLVKNVAIAVRDLLQTLDYAPLSIKHLVRSIDVDSTYFFLFVLFI